MRQTLEKVIPAVAFTIAAIVPWSVAIAQDAAPVSLEEQLKAQYKLVKVGRAGDPQVLEPGTVLAIQKAGILGVPWRSLALCPSKYQDGDLHSPGGFCVAMLKNGSRYFQAGEKVYPLKIDVNLKHDKISFLVVACDSCNGTDPATFFKSDVTFQFSKGYLEQASGPQVEDTIGQVLAIDNSGSEPRQAQNPPAAAPEPAAPQPAAAQPQSKPSVVELGQTPEQVQAVLGQPDKVANVGAKQIYVYKDMKVTFLNGKVSDVQ